MRTCFFKVAVVMISILLNARRAVMPKPYRPHKPVRPFGALSWTPPENILQSPGADSFSAFARFPSARFRARIFHPGLFGQACGAVKGVGQRLQENSGSLVCPASGRTL